MFVLADHDDPAPNTTRGRLFERFIALLLARRFGFQDPTTSDLNVTSDGIELDVVARNRLTNSVAVAECKAYGRPVKANELTNFYGKLTIERFGAPSAVGLFCALPRLVPQGEEKAREIATRDANFRYLSAREIAMELQAAGELADAPAGLELSSDPAILITEHGIYGACLLLDEATRTPIHVAVWANGGQVPDPVLLAVQNLDYSVGLPATDAGARRAMGHAPSEAEHVIATVKGSASDFEYQFPAGPKYFVGRKALIAELVAEHFSSSGSLVLNAQSGWGKSSLALKLQDLVITAGGHAVVVDTRTADQSRYVVEVIRRTALEAANRGVLELPTSQSWASLASALKTLNTATWASKKRPLVIFFDQFENVFRDVELTRAFRDLVLASSDVAGPFLVGFAWKTDLVGWTEGHPYQLRDEIRSASRVVIVEPFGPGEVNILLGRLERAAGEKLFPDLRSRLRAYSQGLPWLLKKLSDHILGEIHSGVTQEQLLSESLNVQTLFQGDLAELNPQQQEVLRYIARYAPLAASEVTERFDPGLVQSLVDLRLIVQVGDRLDTYWDTFRDFLNTGRVPIQDSYILRQTPRSVARLLTRVVGAGGSVAVRDLTHQMSTSDTVIFNLSRELRLLGVTAYEPNRVTVLPEVLAASDKESELRRRIASALRKHKAYSIFRALAERSGGTVTAASFPRDLPSAFPAVEAAAATWSSYARAFLFWILYAGLAVEQGTEHLPTPEGTEVVSLRLLDPPSALRVRRGIPQVPPRRSIAILRKLLSGETVVLPDPSKERDAVGALVALGAVTVGLDRVVCLASDVADSGVAALRGLLEKAPGGQAGLTALQGDPAADPFTVGEAIATALGAHWTPASTHGIGGHFRAWARESGVPVLKARRRQRERPHDQLSLVEEEVAESVE